MVAADLTQINGFAVTVAVVGYLIVFMALVILYLVFNNLPRLLETDLLSFAGKKRKQEGHAGGKGQILSGELNAAIGMALYLHFNEIHDQESGVITIRKISKRYSPWSSKIYGIRQDPRK